MGMRIGLPAKNALTDADDTRYDFRNLAASNADGSPRGGLVAPVGKFLVTGTATMAATVGAFAAMAVRDGGIILLASDGPVTVTLGAAPASNSRYDLIVARQNDASSTVSAPDLDNNPVVYVVPGTAAALPVAPAVPAGSVELGRVLVSAGNTNTNAAVISQAYQYTAGANGIVPSPKLGILELWTTAAQGQLARAIDTGVIYQYFALYNGTTNPGGRSIPGWYPRPGAAPQRMGRISAAGVGTGVPLASGVFPRQTYKQRVVVTFSGNIAGATDGIAGIVVTASAGGTITHSGGEQVVIANSGAGYALMAVVDIAAGTGPDVTVGLVSLTNVALSTVGVWSMQVLAEGEYV